MRLFASIFSILCIYYFGPLLFVKSTADVEYPTSKLERNYKFLKESRFMFYILAQSIMKKREYENCTLVLLTGLENDHVSSETDLIIQQNLRLRPIVYVKWSEFKTSNRKRFESSSHNYKFSERCYVIFGQFPYRESNARKLRVLYETYLPNAKFILRLLPELHEINEIVPGKPKILSSVQAEFTWKSWNILEVVVASNKLNQTRLLLYSFCPHCYPPGRRVNLYSKRGYPVLSAGMGYDGILKEYQSSLFPIYTDNFQNAEYHLVYHASSLSSVANIETSISTEVNHAFYFINLIAERLNLSVDIRKLKYAYEVGTQSSDGVWNGYIGQLMANPNSIGLAFTPHSKYSDVVQTSHPYGTFSIGMIYIDATFSEKMSVWVAFSQLINLGFIINVIIFVFCIGGILCAIEFCQRKFFPALAVTRKSCKYKGWEKYTWMHKWTDYAWLPVKIWFQQTFRLSHIRLKTSLLFIGLWWFTAIYYSTFVKTFLISVMTQSPKSKLLVSLADLMEKEDWTWGTFLKPSVWSDLVGNSSFKKLSKDMHYFDSHTSCVEKVSESKFACIGTGGILKAYKMNPNAEHSHLVYVDTELLPSYLTLAFRKHSPFAQLISKSLQSLVEAEMHYILVQQAISNTILRRKKKENIHPDSKDSSKSSDTELINDMDLILDLHIGGEDVDLSFKEQLADSFEEIFEEAEVEDIFSFVFMGFLFAFLIFCIEQICFAVRNVRALSRERMFRPTEPMES